MPSINLYKIEDNRIKELEDKLESSEFEIISERTIESEKEVYEFSLYFNPSSEKKPLSWNWILEAFETDDVAIEPSPRSVVLIKGKSILKEGNFAITFGSAFFVVDSYCDRNFPFDIASRVRFNKIKTTTVTSPNSKRNKTVNTYVDYNEIIYDSGESFAKLKVNLEEDVVDMFSPQVEIGNSIKLNINGTELEIIVGILSYLLEVEKRPTINNIPYFKEVRDKDKKLALETEFDKNITKDIEVLGELSTVELEIIGTSEVFSSVDNNVQFQYKRHKSEQRSGVVFVEFCKFCAKIGVISPEDMRKVNIVFYKDGESKFTRKINQCLDFTVDGLKCVLYQGKWYEYSAEYLKYLNNSLINIDNVYNPEYDFSEKIHIDFLKSVYFQNRPSANEVDFDSDKSTLKKQIYSERCFNMLRALDGTFENHDREIEDKSFEKMDLYEKDTHTMFAVKMGNSSAKLCYAIDQSIVSLKKLKEGKTPFPDIERVGIWLIFSVKNKYKMKNEHEVDLTSVDMLMLKNRLDQWKKEVLLAGLTPVLYINYRSKD